MPSDLIEIKDLKLEVVSLNGAALNNRTDNSAPQITKSPIPPEESRLLSPDGEKPLESHKKNGCCSCKYTNSLKTLLPWRPSRKDKKVLPSNTASLLNYFSISWLTLLMWKSWRKGVQASDIWRLHPQDASKLNSRRMERLWEQERQDAKETQRAASFARCAWKFVRTRIFVCFFISLCLNALSFIGPSVLVKVILDYINDPIVDPSYAVFLSFIVIMLHGAKAALFSSLMVFGIHTAIRLTGALQAMIYKKMLTLKASNEKTGSQITNICSNDMERLIEFCVSSSFFTVTPVLFFGNLAYAYYLIGPMCLVGFAVYLLFFPVMILIGKGQSRLRLITVKKTDKRVSLINEILNSLRLIKMYAWEDSFTKTVVGIRTEEMKKHKIASLLQAVSSTAVPTIGILSTISTILGCTAAGIDLSSATAFTIFSVFNSMQHVIAILPYTIRNMAEGKVSLNRIQKLLDLPENDNKSCRLFNNSLAIEIKIANFSWDVYSIDLKAPSPVKKAPKKKTTKDSNAEKVTEEANGSVSKGLLEENGEAIASAEGKEAPSNDSIQTLYGINLSVGKGKLLGICGSIGSGKSSLLSSISGDMDLKSGDLKVDGRLALVTQQAWIYNESLRENILMGADFAEPWYEEVVEACALLPDFDLLPNRDETEIGERGINLSGGQKQRVSLARAVYSKRDIYLLDDPLSAVDTKVANHIFSKCIQGLLKDKTVLMASHGVHLLEMCDEIIFLKNGRICERGSHSTLVKREGEYFKITGHDSTHSQKAEIEEKDVDEIDGKKDSNTSDTSLKGKLTKEEEKLFGTINPKTYLKFIEVCGGWFKCLIVFSAILLFSATNLFNFIWLRIWFDAGDGYEQLRLENQTVFNISYSDKELKGNITDNPKLWLYQLVYGMCFVVLLFVGFIKGIGVTFRVLAGSSKLHNDMFKSIVHSPMSFLDATPTGRILNRFSRDIDEVDVRIPFFVEFVFQGGFGILIQFLLVCYMYPIFIGPFIVIFALFVCTDIFMNGGIRELKRLDNVQRSPVVQQITSSMTGLSLIRTFDREEEFTNRFYKYLDAHSAALLVFRLANRWYTFRMDILASFVMFSITTICVFSKTQFSTAYAGLAITTLSGACGFLPFLMRMKADLISRFTCVERLMEYAYNVKGEAPQEIEATKPPASWPSEGKLELREVSVRYRSDLPLVLHGITASIDPSEKIGIVGRTGAGKSSLISTILRLIELESGTISIDGIDISKIGLHPLRSAISVIPQDPVLFQGTLRYNVDPFEEHSDEAIWDALEHSHLKDAAQNLNHGLNAEVKSGGENFSVGERQLICLTRALLRKTKVLLLDEATASVDLLTDQLIQKTIQESFSDCTVLTIAHRLNTVSSYNRVMVLDGGRIMEFDSPENLMNRDGSLFAEMMNAMGIKTAEQMMQL